MTRRRWLSWAALAAASSATGCASLRPDSSLKNPDMPLWRGRLSLRVRAEPGAEPAPDQVFNAAFELQGQPAQAELRFFTPLGSTAAVIAWAPGMARLQARGETRLFDDVRQLIQHLLGTDVPVPALFSWLDGQAQDADGWQADLSQQSQGKISARRLFPAPVADLRVILER